MSETHTHTFPAPVAGEQVTYDWKVDMLVGDEAVAEFEIIDAMGLAVAAAADPPGVTVKRNLILEDASGTNVWDKTSSQVYKAWAKADLAPAKYRLRMNFEKEIGDPSAGYFDDPSNNGRSIINVTYNK